MNKDKTIYLSALNVIACISVIYIHVNGESWSYSDSINWIIALLIETICYFAVPVFFMITGATLMNYRERYSTSVFLKRRMKRIGIPYVFWSLLYFFANVCLGDVHITETSDLIVKLISSVTGYSSQGVFWYLQAIINVYFCLPILSLLAGDDYRKERLYMLFLGGITWIIIPLFIQFTPIEFGNHYGLYIMSGFLFYVVLGYELSCMSHFNIKLKALLVVFSILVISIKYIGTIKLSSLSGSLDTSYYGYMTVYAAAPAASLFVIMKSCKFSNSCLRGMIIKLSELSFGVYLVHMPIIRFFAYLNKYHNTGLIYNLLAGAGVYLVSLAIVFVIRRIPIINRVIP